MRLYDFLLTVKKDKKVKVIIIRDTETYTVYAESVTILDENIQDAMISSWEILGNQTIKVELESYIPSI